MVEVGFLSAANILGRHSRKNSVVAVSQRGSDMSSFEWEKWNLVDLVRSLGMVAFYVMACFARILLVFLPQRIPLYRLSSALENFSHEVSPSPPLESELDDVTLLTSGAIGRALLQVLALVNDLPAYSSKYEFARTLAERIIHENAAHGHGYESVNRMAVCAGFKRTLVMLNRSLESIHREESARDLWSLPKKVLQMLPMPTGGLKFGLPLPLSLLRSPIGFFIPSILATVSGPQAEGFPATLRTRVANTDMAEKLAQELLWLAEKLVEASALDEGIVQWSSSASLASISLVASPRVQRALVRLSALFAKELVAGNAELSRDVKFKMLLLWLPLFCAATHGGDMPVFTVSERIETEIILDKAIKSLPESDQEVILAIWLHEFALSTSDWPNLQASYNGWCNSTRKLSDLPQQSMF